MQYSKSVVLKNGTKCYLRNATGEDAQAVLENLTITHEQTDYLLTYSDEKNVSLEQEITFLSKRYKSEKEVIIIASVDGKIVGTAGIEAVGDTYKVQHRAVFGISISKDYWGLGIGKALTESCIECAKKAGYKQLELDVVAENINAVSMYKKAGFIEYGRNPRGFNSRLTGFQELVYMRLEL